MMFATEWDEEVVVGIEQAALFIREPDRPSRRHVGVTQRHQQVAQPTLRFLNLREFRRYPVSLALHRSPHGGLQGCIGGLQCLVCSLQVAGKSLLCQVSYAAPTLCIETSLSQVGILLVQQVNPLTFTQALGNRLGV